MSHSQLLGEGNGTPLQYSCLENPMDHNDFITLPFHVALSGCGGDLVGALQGMGSSRVALKGSTSRLGGKFQGQVHMGEEE